MTEIRAESVVSSDRKLHVVFTVGDAEYALAASEVAQMEAFEGTTPVPGAAPYVAGLIQVRGRVVPVIDLRTRFGLPPVARTMDTRVVVSEQAGRPVGLLDDRAREVVLLAAEQIKPPPGIVAAQTGGLVSAIANVGARILMLVDLTKLIGEEQHDGH